MTRNYNRKTFLKKAALLAGGTLIVPKLARALPANEDMPPLNFAPNAIIDLHCHPSLKMYLWGKKFWKRHHLRSPGENILHMQEDTHEFEYGTVRGIVAKHYLLEAGVEQEWLTLKFVWPLFRRLFFTEADKIEHDDFSNFTQINTMMDELEWQLHTSYIKHQKVEFVIARNYGEFEDALKTPGKLPIAHAIEGAHALGRNFVQSQKNKQLKQQIASQNPALINTNVSKVAVLPNEGKMTGPANDAAYYYKRNLKALFDRGLAVMTLSHFFPNDIAYPVEGVSPQGKWLPGFNWHYDPVKMNCGLTDIGREVVRYMLEIGVAVDLTHSTAQVRQDVFTIRDKVNDERRKAGKCPRPVVFTHVGSKEVFDRHDMGKYKNYGFYDVTTEEIAAVCKDGGVMGVIAEIFWLAGSDKNPAIPGQPKFNKHKGIPYMIETMKWLNKYTPCKQYDNIAIGTDFDGLADNPKDMFLNRNIADLIQEMQKDQELAPHVAKITHGNAKRLLSYAWGDNPRLTHCFDPACPPATNQTQN